MQIQLFRVLRPTLVSLAIRRALALSPPPFPSGWYFIASISGGEGERGSLRIVVCRAVGARNDNRDPYVRCVFSAMDACRGNAGALLLSRNLKIPPSSPPFPVFFPSPSFPTPECNGRGRESALFFGKFHFCAGGSFVNFATGTALTNSRGAGGGARRVFSASLAGCKSCVECGVRRFLFFFVCFPPPLS